MDSIAEKIKALRTSRNISQEELADKIMVSRQAISRWENGAVSPSVDNLIAISKFFNVNLDYFLDNEISATDGKSIEKSQAINEISRQAVADWLFIVALVFLGMADLTFFITSCVFFKIYLEHFGDKSPVSLSMLLIFIALLLVFVGLTVFTAVKYARYRRSKNNM